MSMKDLNNNNLIGCIVETQNPAIVRMMKSHGCQYSENNGLIQFSKETKSIKKAYRDDIQFSISQRCSLAVNGGNIQIEGAKAWKTTTGWEHVFIADITLKDKNTKRTLRQVKAKGIGVFSENQNHYYAMFQIENTNQLFYVDRWFDENSNLIKATKGSERQTNRVYEIV